VKYPGWVARFIKPMGTICATIYKDKPPGNSPENARGLTCLDSYGFVMETWTVVGAPSNARITEDISG
jgi:hypothetical protein